MEGYLDRWSGRGGSQFIRRQRRHLEESLSICFNERSAFPRYGEINAEHLRTTGCADFHGIAAGALQVVIDGNCGGMRTYHAVVHTAAYPYRRQGQCGGNEQADKSASPSHGHGPNLFDLKYRRKHSP